MTPITMRRTRVLDGERIFRIYYTDMGTARSLGKVKIQLGSAAINPRTGRQVNDMAIWGSMYRWAASNVDESYKIFSAAMRDEGKFHTLDEWKDFLFKNMSVLVKHGTSTVGKWKARIGVA